jgi:hypothetical protein
MTTTASTSATDSSRRPPMSSLRRTALLVGVLFLITYVTSIASKFFLYSPLLDNPDYIVSAGEDTRVLWGAFSEAVLIIANIGSAVAIYPVLRHRYPALALGFVTARVMESVFIAVGILSILTVVTLRQDVSGAGDAQDATLQTVGSAFTALQEWTFNLGPGVVVGVGNGLLLGYMMYRSRLVPRGMAMLGLVGGSLLFLSGSAVVLDVIEAGGTAHTLAAMPEFFWELSFGIYLVVKGFRPSAVTAETVAAR